MNEKRATIIAVACLILFVIGIGASFYYFHMTVLEEKKQQLSQVKVQVQEATRKKNNIRVLEGQIQKLKEEEATLIRHIPNLDRAEYDTLANLLDGFRRRAGVVVDSAKWVVPQKKQPVANIPVKNVPPTVHKVQFDLNVEGSFYQLLRYVNLLEQDNRFIDVESFSIAKSTEVETGPQQRIAPKREMKISVFSYTYKPTTPEIPLIDSPEQTYGRSTEVPD